MSGLFFGAGSSAPPTAQFVKLDSTTQGNWKGVYGADGYNVIGSSASYPGYVTPAPGGNPLAVWAPAATDTRALQTVSGSTRIAASWYTYSSFTVDLPFTGAGTYQMAVYCLDWDQASRTQTLQILDANNNVLDTRNISNFASGIWVVWSLSGHVQLRMTLTGGANAVMSGVFFAP